MSERRPILAHVRVVLIAAVCFVATCAAFPMPGPATDKALQDEAGQAELNSWIELLGNIGINTTTEELSAWVMWVSRTSRAARNAVVDPVKPVFRVTGTQQGWGLFAYPDTHPHTLVIQGAPHGGPYRTLYRSHDWEHQWLHGRLHYRRIRALYNPGQRPPRTYGNFVTWVSGMAFDDFADVDRVQVYFTRQRTRLPWEPPPEPVSKPRHRKVRTRATDGGAP